MPFRQDRVLRLLVAWLVLVWLWSAINPTDYEIWVIENLLVAGYVALLVLTQRRLRFSNASYALFVLFMTLHLVGAHYSYAEVPLGRWLQALYEGDRNPYDRIVHFAFGLLIAYPMWEALLRSARTTPAWSYFLAVTGILAFSAFYELLEAAIVVMLPHVDIAWLATQGDPWDTHKDTALAFAGGILAMLFTRWRVGRYGIPFHRR
ncbi:MAG TPA: DUF2238 domain-containing protein [Thioalkalivibrio sp.]|nr:DUF2238 domain-containing protein [Thioalkalivibrio sp.]